MNGRTHSGDQGTRQAGLSISTMKTVAVEEEEERGDIFVVWLHFPYIHVLLFVVSQHLFSLSLLAPLPCVYTLFVVLSFGCCSLYCGSNFIILLGLFHFSKSTATQPINDTNVIMIQNNCLCASCKIIYPMATPSFFCQTPVLFHPRPSLGCCLKKKTLKDSLFPLFFSLPSHDSYAPAYQQYRDRLAVVHFIGNFKPWQWLRFADGAVFPRNTSSKDSIDLVQQWWNVFDNFVGGKVCLHSYTLYTKYAARHGGK
jgi:hypothetical protein